MTDTCFVPAETRHNMQVRQFLSWFFASLDGSTPHGETNVALWTTEKIRRNRVWRSHFGANRSAATRVARYAA